MKTLFFLVLIISLTAGGALSSELSEQQQQEILDQMLYLYGQGPCPISLESIRRPHCATDIVHNFLMNRDNFTGKYAAMAEALADRPALPYFYDTPGGHFRIHYDTTGIHRVYQAEIDTVPDGPDNIPDYVNIVGRIADSAWNFEIDSLGFPPPVSDDTSGGGTDRVDIYLPAIENWYYGWTAWETIIPPQSMTSYIVIDNDYAGIPPYNGQSDLNGRLDAARVTVAHEFFHTIHYTMDWTEFENQGTGSDARYWWEISAVWMEEMMYDDINDYYFYLEDFYNVPWKGLQAVTSSIDLHQYASAIWPIFLTEKFDASVVRVIWEKCRDYGPGPHFPIAANDAIDSITNQQYDLRTAFQEFAIWNYFTGSRATQAPTGYSFQEAADYAMLPDSAILTFNDYGVRILQWVDPPGGGWPDTLSNGDSVILNGIPIGYYEDRMPQNLSAHYIHMQNLEYLTDSLFNFGFFGQRDEDYGTLWNLSIIQFPIDGISPPVISTYEHPVPGAINIENQNNLYNHIMAIATPTSTNYLAYFLNRNGNGYGLVFFDTTIMFYDDEFVFRAPYPNPIGLSAADDSVTFRVDILAAAPGHPGQLEVTIFDIAGAKVNKIESSYGALLNSHSPATVGWDLKNSAGRRVAAGVYLVYCKLKFNDGTPSVSDKFKIAVIR